MSAELDAAMEFGRGLAHLDPDTKGRLDSVAKALIVLHDEVMALRWARTCALFEAEPIQALKAKVDSLRIVNGQVLEPYQPDDSTKGMFQASTLLEWLRT